MATESIPRWPLEWPLGWKRARVRRSATNFSMSRTDGDGIKKRTTAVNMATATDRLETQIAKLGGKDAVLSTNVSLNLRGQPRGDESPGDPGAAVYFVFRGRATVLACDTFFRVADNIAALAAHIEALRRIDRYGVGTIEQALAGYKALPADTAADWRSVFQVAAGRHGDLARNDVETAYRMLARERHPDIAHDDGAAMAHLNRARDYAIAELEGRS